MDLTNQDFEDARGALLRLQAKAMQSTNTRLVEQLSIWLYELETQRWVSTRSVSKNQSGVNSK